MVSPAENQVEMGLLYRLMQPENIDGWQTSKDSHGHHFCYSVRFSSAGEMPWWATTKPQKRKTEMAKNEGKMELTKS